MTGDAQPPGTGASVELDSYQAMVLLVDDQVMIAEAVRRALAGQPNLDFHCCLNPNEALAIARNLKPTVILQDLIMPGVDGLDLVQQYRQVPEIAQVPIIVLSSQEDPAIKSRAFERGANDYLVKLPDRVELIARIRYHSRACLNQIQRDDAYRALQESQQQLMLANLKLERMTRIDGLTGLSNRRHFNEYLVDEWNRALRKQEQMTIIMIDVDHFKRFNDTYGHLTGDDVLVRVAGAIKRCCSRPTDFSARFGGEEFVVIISGLSAAEAADVARRLRAEVAAMAIPHGGTPDADIVTISLGVATITPRHEIAAVQLVEAADRALFRAKAEGRNGVVCADPSDIEL
jgi:two-component system, chemotaxis family, response regulator WspR